MRTATWLLLALLGCSRSDAAPGAEPSAEPSVETSPVATESGEPSAAPVEPTATAAPSASAAPPPAPPEPERATVTLAGELAPRPLPEGAPRLAAVAWLVRIYAKPSSKARVVGYLRAGGVVEAGGAEATKGDGCREGFRALVPQGYVCAGDVTDDLEHPVVRATGRRPDPAFSLPYMYGTGRAAGPIYARLPTPEQLAEHEPELEEHLDRWLADEQSGASYGLDVWLRHHAAPDTVPTAVEALKGGASDADVPWFLRDGALPPRLSDVVKGDDPVRVDRLLRRQGRSFTHSVLHAGRRYNVTPDLLAIPADLLRPIRGSAFQGWQVGDDLAFPFAIVRREGGRKWSWDPDRKRMTDAGELPWRALLPLTGKQQMYGKKLHYETKEGFYVDDRHASRIDPAKKWPKWAKQGAKWLDVSLSKQVLVAYEGREMVYATLISSGEAGLDDPATSTATVRGIFRVHTKWVTTTMDSDAVGEAFELRDVPYVQYFREGYALHGAYWHDRFGQPKSHGCINLAPEDARRLFHWTDPQVPPGWHGVRTSLTGTHIFVHD